MIMIVFADVKLLLVLTSHYFHSQHDVKTIDFHDFPFHHKICVVFTCIALLVWFHLIHVLFIYVVKCFFLITISKY